MIAVASTSSFSVWTHSVGALFVVMMTEVFSWREFTRLKNEADSSFFTGNSMILEILLLLLFGIAWLVKGQAFPFLNDTEEDLAAGGSRG